MEKEPSRGVAVRVADRDEVLELNFVPQWARKSASEGVDMGRYDDRATADTDRDGRRRDRGERPRRDRAGASRDGVRKPRREDSFGGPASRDRAPSSDPARRADGRGRAPGAPAPAAADRRSDRPPRQAATFRQPELAPLPPVDVRFVPEQKHLAALIRQVTGSRRAYPLMDLAHLLLEREGCCFVKLGLSREATPETLFHICRLCGCAAMNEADIRTHIQASHFDEIFAVEEVAVEPPGGHFVCVAKCGLSGEYLGPPNHHSYNERIRELHASRYGHLSLDEYRSRIVLLHEPDEVEAWKQACSVQRRYRLRSPEGEAAASTEPTAPTEPPEAEESDGVASVQAEGASMSWVEAQTYMRDQVVASALSTARKAVMSEAVARAVTDPGLRRAIREEWQSEMRFPVHLAFALRAAFRHRRLHTFKAGTGKGVNFVTGIEPHPIAPEHTIDMIRQVLTLLHDRPGVSKVQVLEAVVPGVDKESAEAREVLQAIHWLTEKGHIIEFFNGCLSVPLGKHAAGKAAPHRPRPRG